MPVHHVVKPSLVVNEDRCRNNISVMASKARRLGLKFRPHFKTHQSWAAGRWFRDEGVDAITVSSVDMARYFAHDGWTDITLAIPVNPLQAKQVAELSRQINLNLVVVDSMALQPAIALTEGNPPGVFIKVDAGYGRAGLPCERTEDIVALAQKLSVVDKLDFKGILAHDGHTYQATTLGQIESIRHESNRRMAVASEALSLAGMKAMVSAGDTPSCTRSEHWEGVDEIRPGNFAFYDVQQLMAGNCTTGQMALAVYCPVISVEPQKGKAVIYGGAVHFSKDFAFENGERIFGAGFAVKEPGASWPCHLEQLPFRLTALSQEHGILTGAPKQMAQLKPGSLVALFPAHSCLAVAQFKSFLTTSGSLEQTINHWC